jgi:hypothetical protein
MPEVQHVNVKIFATPESTVNWPDLIPVFHRWIQDGIIPDILPIDVADYAHVPAGPGIMLIGHHANISVDNRAGRLGFLYNRKTVFEGSTKQKIEEAYTAAVAACRQLEGEPELKGRLRFDDRKFEVFINDRLLAPNTDETWAALQPEIAGYFEQRFGGSVSLDWKNAPRELFRVELSA